MSKIQTELYEALIEAGTSEPKARAAAEAVAAYPKAGELAAKGDLKIVDTSLHADLNLLRWMVASNLALTAVYVALIFHQ